MNQDTLKAMLSLTPEQLTWVVNLPWKDSDQWMKDQQMGAWLNNPELGIVVTTMNGKIEITTWEVTS